MKRIAALLVVFTALASFAERLGSLTSDSEVLTAADFSGVQKDAKDAMNLASDVATLVYGDDCQLVSTNYNSVTKLPSLFLRFKIKDENTGEMVWYKVWDEMTRWNWFLNDHLPTNYYTKTEINTALETKSDRAWGHYDSQTGNYAPEDFTWISSKNIAIAGGLAYQRILTTSGAVWVLESHGTTVYTGGETNGFFRISDDKGNAIFEITKGTEQVVGATAGQVVVFNDNDIAHLYIPYNVVSTKPPKIEVSRDLQSNEWFAEDSANCPAVVKWTGTSGAYMAEVYGKQPEIRLFVRASYVKGSRDVIKNSAPISFTEVMIDGQIYKCKVEVMNNKKVLVLE